MSYVIFYMCNEDGTWGFFNGRLGDGQKVRWTDQMDKSWQYQNFTLAKNVREAIALISPKKFSIYVSSLIVAKSVIHSFRLDGNIYDDADF